MKKIDNLNFSVTDNWNTGFTGYINFTNKGDNLNGWTLEFDAPYEIKEIWGGSIVSHQGNRYIIKSNELTQNVGYDQKVSIGFNADTSNGELANPSNYIFEGASVFPIANAGIKEVEFSVTSQWEDGFNSIVTLSSQNNSLDGWATFEFDAPYEITDIWGAKLLSREGNHYVISDDWWSPSGQDKVISFSFNAKAKSPTEPYNYQYNQENIVNKPSIDSNLQPTLPNQPSNSDSQGDRIGTDTGNLPSIPSNPGSVSRPDYNHSTGFFTLDGKLYDANGNEFIARGINNLHVYFDDNNDDLNQAYDALDNIASFGFNSVRINWRTEFMGHNTNDAMLEKIIQRTIDLKMVPIVELHDFTGSADTQTFLDKGVKWWTDRANLWDKYENQLLINIANEFGDFEMTKGGNRQIFPNVYKEAISRLRNAGIDNTLVIDSFEWSKDYTLITDYGQEIYNYDPQKNLMFDVHFYSGQGESEAKITDAMESISGQKLPFMVGEFSDQHPAYGKGEGVIDDVKEQHIMSEAEKYGIGYLGWAWHNDPFSVAAHWEATSTEQLTSWGKTMIEGANGIANTSKTATIFG
jgi:mannan endo-1,4-beta-mannosidase